MNILHIASITDNKFNGVCVVVPQHITEHKNFASVGFVNLQNYKINGIENQFECAENFKISNLPAPFNNPDIVVFHEAYRIQYLTISKELRRKKIPYVIIPHGELSEEAQKKKRLKKKVANILLFNSFINRAKAIQCLSEREFNSTKFGKRKFIGTNGIYIPDKKKISFRNTGIKFLYVGRLDAYHKGLDLMLDAVSISAESMRADNSKLYIYGPDYQGRYAHLESLIAEREISDIVILNHEISGKEKEEILLDADVFIQTSRFEGMPMGILEAMSYGLPVIITEGTTLGSFVNENDIGWVCQTDATEISMCLKDAISKKDKLYDISARAPKSVAQGFEWSVIAQKTVEKYSELIKLKNK